MECPECGGPLDSYVLGGREAVTCERCGWVGIEADHRGEGARSESWDDALARFYERNVTTARRRSDLPPVAAASDAVPEETASAPADGAGSSEGGPESGAVPSGEPGESGEGEPDEVDDPGESDDPGDSGNESEPADGDETETDVDDGTGSDADGGGTGSAADDGTVEGDDEAESDADDPTVDGLIEEAEPGARRDGTPD